MENADRQEQKPAVWYYLSNAGFLGNPVAEGVYGQMGLALASIYLIPQRIVMWSEGLAIFSKEIDKKQILKKVLLHPCIIACEIGLLLMLTQCPLPAAVKTFVGNLGDCNTILSMLVIGMIVSDIRLKEILDRDIIIYTVIRASHHPCAGVSALYLAGAA
mgnify:CR=1 FL=1